MKPETLMWLFPIVFMIHDFEEIIMMKPWRNRFSALLNDRLPKWLRNTANRTLNLSTPGFAFAVLLIFVMLSIVTYICVELDFKAFWLGIVTVYFLHLIMHLFQGIFLKNYVPAIISSILTGIYCLYVFWYASRYFDISWLQVGLSILIGMVPFVGMFALIIFLANLFDRWLTKFERGE